MTKIVVISDTHISGSGPKIPERLVEELKSADLCIHAGDFVGKHAVAEIERYAKLVGVKGNMDGDDITFPRKTVITVEGVKIGVIHGQGSPRALPEYSARQFGGEKDLRIVIFGHSHHPFNETRGGVVLFNPGSPTDTMYTDVNSFGIIEIDQGKVLSCRLITL